MIFLVNKTPFFFAIKKKPFGSPVEAMMEIERMLDWSLADDPVPEDEAR